MRTQRGCTWPTLIAIALTVLCVTVTYAGTTRIGTFDTRGVALCYGRSDAFMERVSAMKDEHAQAEAAGDVERVAELERLGPALQDTLHRQAFGGAPIWNILAGIEEELPAIAEAAGVDAIVVPLYGDTGDGLVDITREMVAPFEPDEQTLSILDELMETDPVEMGE